MEQVLLLNQSYEPISIIGWKKAITLVALEKVEIVEEYQRKVRSKYLTMKMPAVIRLLKMFRRPRKRVKFNRQNILLRDRFYCQYCKQQFPVKELTYDHVIPRSRGGKTCWENIVTCCNSCNTKKGNRMPQEVNMKVYRQPTRPDWIPIFIASLSQQVIPEPWKNFCFWDK